MKKLKVVLICALLIGTLAGCSVAGSSKNTGETVNLRLGIISGNSQAPYVYATVKKMYEEQGINVEPKYFSSAKDRDTAFFAGELDVATADLTASTIYLSQGYDIKATGGTNSLYRLVTSPKLASENPSIKDLDGKNLAISEKTVIEFYTDTLAQTNGIKFSKKAIPKIPDRLAALASGQVDAAIMPEPFASAAIKAGGKELWNSDESGVMQIGSLIWKADILETNPDLAQKFVDITNKATNEMNEAGADSYKSMLIESGLVKEEEFEISKNLKLKPMNTVSEQTWDAVNQWAIEKEITKEPFDYKSSIINLKE